MYPKVVISADKIRNNIKVIKDKCDSKNISIMGITKVYSGFKPVVEIFQESGIEYIGDSRLKNLTNYRDISIPKVLIRLPMISEVNEVVNNVDISFNSEVGTISMLNKFAGEIHTVHKIVLMVDLGDLREGILPDNVEETVNNIRFMKNIEIVGIAVNLTCYGGVIPTEKNLVELLKIKDMIEKQLNKKIEIVSGGNSSSLYLIEKNIIPKGINNIRLGESIALGRETAFGSKIDKTYDDAVLFYAEIIELKEKPSLPEGDIGIDAFGKKPVFVDRGIRKRVILGVGKQDVNYKDLLPIDDKIILLGSSSDHLIVDITDSNKDYKLGDTIEFKLTYGSLLSLMTSNYVTKEMI